MPPDIMLAALGFLLSFNNKEEREAFFILTSLLKVGKQNERSPILLAAWR